MADDQERLARGLELRQQRAIEEPLEGGVLVRGPFIEDADRAILEPARQERQPPPLPMGEIERRERMPAERDTSRQAKPFQAVAGPRGEILRREPEQVREEMTVGEDDREELAIRLAIRIGQRAAIEPDAARRGHVKSRDELGQRRLARPIAAGHDHDLSRPERQVDGTEREARIIAPIVIGKCDILQAERCGESPVAGAGGPGPLHSRDLGPAPGAGPEAC